MIKVKMGDQIMHLPTLKGANGKSAYQYAVEAGFEGTEQEFINLLIDGANGINTHLSDSNSHADIRRILKKLQDNNSITIRVDNELNPKSNNPVENGVIYEALNKKIEKEYVDDAVADKATVDFVNKAIENAIGAALTDSY